MSPDRPVIADPGDRLSAAERARLGAWYTPHPLVAAVVAEALFPGARSVLDPACGDGRFLRATGLPEQTGVDIDAAVPDAIHDDALTRDWRGQRFDVVVGNPPFGGRLRRRTRRDDPARFGGGPYADTAAEFLALAISLTRPGGRVGLVLPQSLLGSRDAAPIRAMVDASAALRWMWWTDDRVFAGASVRVWAGVWEIGGPPGPVRRAHGPVFEPIAPMAMPPHWPALLDADGPPSDPSSSASAGTSSGPDGQAGPTLGSIATFNAGFRDQYYGLVGAVHDSGSGPPLVTSGLIDRDECAWGRRATRFHHTRYGAPRVDLDALAAPIRAWAERQLVPKILIANQTREVEAVHDAHGAWLPCVPVITCRTEQPARVLDVLHAPATQRWIRACAGGTGLSAGVVRLSPGLLAAVPLP